MIHKIFSDLPSFKNQLELRAGLNVLLAQKTVSATKKQTRNRAGKSSFVEIVDFLMGAKPDPKSIFRTQALGESWFGIEFDLGGKPAKAERTGKLRTAMQVSIPPDARTTLSVEAWRDHLSESMFGLHTLERAGARPPSFRSLFSYFARRQSSNGFTTPEKHAEMQQIGDQQMALMFLLGLDWQIARDWQAVRDREKTLKELKKAAGVGALGPIIGKAAELRTELTLKEARVKKMHEDISGFQVLPEYRELERESATLTRQLNELTNANTIDLIAVRDLENALTSELPPQLEDLQTLYEEAGVMLPGLVSQRYEDVKSFHESVVRNRRDYLSSELEAAKLRVGARDLSKFKLDGRRVEIMGVLKSHGALDQYVKLQSELSRHESELESLRQRFETAEQLQSEKNELQIERNKLTIRLQRDFVERKECLSEAILAFEETSRQLYEAAGSMTIDDSDPNGPAFQFIMQGNRSKGIKNMQIFCFDMMLMRICAKRKIGPGFLIHDSHLFDGVDGRQVISALHVGAEISKELGFQYIVTMNEDDAFKEKIDGFDLNDYVLPTRLTDASDDGGLFGIRFG